MRVSESIETLKPYVPGKPIEETQREFGLAHVVKLASNENPLGPSPKALKALSESSLLLHRYPDASCYQLAKLFSEIHSLKTSQLVFGNGSNELIDLLIRVFSQPGDSILTSECAFIAYRICAQAHGLKTETVPMTSELCFDLPALESKWKVMAKKPKMIFIANPNNPTGTFVNNSAIESLLRATAGSETLVVLDEAYSDYVTNPNLASWIPRTSEFPHLVILRTFSKIHALAGLRLGVAVGDEGVLGYLHRVRNPFNVSSAAQVAGCASLLDEHHIEASRTLNTRELARVESEIKGMGLRVFPSQGNFLLFQVGARATEVYQSLLSLGIILRPVREYGLTEHLRMSIGLPEENTLALHALQKTLIHSGITTI